MGNSHHNNHISGVLINAAGKPVFVQDTYIKVRKDDGTLIHILIDVPKLDKMEIVTYKRPQGCDFTPTLMLPGIK